jgi:hypothetical protein
MAKNCLQTTQEKSLPSTIIKIVPTLYFDFFRYFRDLKFLVFKLSDYLSLFIDKRRSDMRIVAQKSAALAAQNFMISMAAVNYDTCPMEGFDSLRVKKY